MITVSPEHLAERAAGALAATLVKLNSGVATVSLYTTVRPAGGGAAGASAQAVFTLKNPASVIVDGVLTLTRPDDAMAMVTGEALWARIVVNGAYMLDGDVSDAEGDGLIKLAATYLYAGSLVHLLDGTLS